MSLDRALALAGVFSLPFVANAASPHVPVGTVAMLESRYESHVIPLRGEVVRARQEKVLPVAQPTEVLSYTALVAQASRANGVDGALIHAVIRAESDYDPRALSPAGAAGLMQLMPDTARQYGVRDVFDPAQNIRAGARMLRELLDRFGGDVELALAAYNAGAYAVERAGNRIPGHPQTAAYVPKVMGIYRELLARKG